jgi:hypothetical protein
MGRAQADETANGLSRSNFVRGQIVGVWLLASAGGACTWSPALAARCWGNLDRDWRSCLRHMRYVWIEVS